MSLSTSFLGLNLKNPIIIAAGPWSRNAEAIQKSIDNGAGAVITETITLETGINIRPRLHKNNAQLFNIMLYSSLALEEWEFEFKKIDKKDSYVICSIWGASPSEMAYIALKVERMGADAIEMSISAPIGTKSDKLTHFPNYIGESVKAVVDVVNIPVMVKLSYNSSLYTNVVKSIEKAGAKGITGIDSLKALQGVDIENQRSIMPAYGGYTGENIRPISLATIATLAQISTCELSGVGGIFNYKNVLEYIMLGANTTQLASSILLNGQEIIGEILTELQEWMIEHEYSDINTLRGTALKTLAPYEDIPVKNYIARAKSKINCSNCKDCLNACMYEAIKIVGGIPIVDEKLCTGCGLCLGVCPKNFELVWK